MSPIEFQAPWSRKLKGTTAIVVASLCLLSIVGFFIGAHLDALTRLVVSGIPLALLLIAALTMVRGYALTQDEILVRRLGRVTRLPLATLHAVDGKADAMRGSLRLLIVGGVFAFVGWYWNAQLRLYQALATDPSRAVILRYPNRTIVITPHDPQHFIARSRTLMKTMSYRA